MTTEDCSMGQQEVLCQECGASLGYQGPGEIQWDYWLHARCPVRLARRLTLDRDGYDLALQITTSAIVGAYPDFPMGVHDPDPDGIRLQRARMAAEMVLERLGGLYDMERRA